MEILYIIKFISYNNYTGSRISLKLLMILENISKGKYL